MGQALDSDKVSVPVEVNDVKFEVEIQVENLATMETEEFKTKETSESVSNEKVKGDVSEKQKEVSSEIVCVHEAQARKSEIENNPTSEILQLKNERNQNNLKQDSADINKSS